MRALAALLPVSAASPAVAVAQPPELPAGQAGQGLPAPVADPLAIDAGADPILALARAGGDAEAFRRLVQRAVEESPASDEAAAEVVSAEAGRGEARAGLFPTVDVGATSQRRLLSSFSNRIETIVEQSRAQSRTDVTLNAQQTLLDFGVSRGRIEAANARLTAAAANVDDAADRTALLAIAAWYDVYMFRAMVRLGGAFSASQAELRDAIGQRILEGLSARGDAARVTSTIAAADARLADYRRRLSDAEARYTQMLREPPPPTLARPPVGEMAEETQLAAGRAALDRPAVRVADAQAEAARRDAYVARRETYPNLSAGIQAGRYGILEDFDDYDVRAVVTLRKRFFGGVDARADRVRAQAGVSEARAAATREQSVREAEVAWADVRALEVQQEALRASYLAARQSRDVLAERFRVARGTLFDLLAAEDSFFLTAASFIQNVGELDAARYVLLSRTGRLLDAVGIPAAEERER